VEQRKKLNGNQVCVAFEQWQLRTFCAAAMTDEEVGLLAMTDEELLLLAHLVDLYLNYSFEGWRVVINETTSKDKGKTDEQTTRKDFYYHTPGSDVNRTTSRLRSLADVACYVSQNYHMTEEDSALLQSLRTRHPHFNFTGWVVMTWVHPFTNRVHTRYYPCAARNRVGKTGKILRGRARAVLHFNNEDEVEKYIQDQLRAEAAEVLLGISGAAAQAGPSQAGPSQAAAEGSSQAGPSQAGPSQAGPSQAAAEGSSQAGPSGSTWVHMGWTEPSHAGPSQATPSPSKASGKRRMVPTSISSRPSQAWPSQTGPSSQAGPCSQAGGHQKRRRNFLTQDLDAKLKAIAEVAATQQDVDGPDPTGHVSDGSDVDGGGKDEDETHPRMAFVSASDTADPIERFRSRYRNLDVTGWTWDSVTEEFIGPSTAPQPLRGLRTILDLANHLTAVKTGAPMYSEEYQGIPEEFARMYMVKDGEDIPDGNFLVVRAPADSYGHAFTYTDPTTNTIHPFLVYEVIKHLGDPIAVARAYNEAWDHSQPIDTVANVQWIDLSELERDILRTYQRQTFPFVLDRVAELFRVEDTVADTTDTTDDEDTSGITDDSSVACEECGLLDSPNMLLCDNCGHGYHTHCIDMETVPDGQWLCPVCDQGTQADDPADPAITP
jgi:hypothetical protein